MRPPSDEPNLVAGRRRANDLDSGFVADSRRRLGGHSRARQFLVSELGNAAAAGGVWRGLVSALQRHAVENAIIEMSPEDKEVLTLAYLQGQTNSQIASRLNVSASTVRRRLSVALARLEEGARRSGAWVSSVTTAAVLQIVEQGARVGRVVGAVRPLDLATGLTGAVAAGTLVVVGVGLVVPEHHFSKIDRVGAPAAAHLAASPQDVQLLAKKPSAGSEPSPVKAAVAAGQPVAEAGRESSDVEKASVPSAGDAPEGCHGKPTSKAKAHDQNGASVTHPSTGGCSKG